MPLSRTIQAAWDSKFETLLPKVASFQKMFVQRPDSQERYLQCLSTHKGYPTPTGAGSNPDNLDEEVLHRKRSGKNPREIGGRVILDPLTTRRIDEREEIIERQHFNWTDTGLTPSDLRLPFMVKINEYRAPKNGRWSNGVEIGYEVVATGKYQDVVYHRTYATGPQSAARTSEGWEELLSER